GQPVGAVDQTLVRYPQHLKAALLDLRRKSFPEPGRRFAFQQRRRRGFGDRIAGGLGGVPHVGGSDADQLGAHDLTGTRLLALAQAPPRLSVLWGGGGEASGHWG